MCGVGLPITPEEIGVFRYGVRFDPAGLEAFPVRNNTADFTTNVRDDKVRVLFVDWKPGWETRFALNIFRRLDFRLRPGRR